MKSTAGNIFRPGRLLTVILFFILLWSVFLFAKSYLRTPTDNGVSYTNNCNYVLSLRIPADLHFCGEKIPFNDYEIRNGLEREFYNNNYWKANSHILFNRAQRWFPLIEPILKREGIPDDFKYLAVIESHLTNATSPAAAVGFWQLVPVTATNYGLEINQWVDERYDVEKSTIAACKHLRDAHAILKNWTLSAAAYNLGINGIVRAMENQKSKNYYDLLLNPETGSFIYRILAYKTLFSDPAHFGIKKRRTSFWHPTFKTVKVDSSVVALPAFARHLGTDAQTLKAFNPWLVGSSLYNPAHKTYYFKLPKKGIDYEGYLSDVSSVPYVPPSVKKDTLSKSAPQAEVDYVVRVTEPLANVARLFGVTEAELREWNNLQPNEQAVAGRTLVVRRKQE